MKIFNVSLNKRWKEVVFACSGFGPNLLMVLMMAYFTDAVIPTGLQADINFWSYGGATIVAIAFFPILWTLGRVFDGIIDVPLAALTDTIRNKTGKRNISIVISFLPMLISFVLCWLPVFGMGKDISLAQQIGNSIWIFVWSIVFFASYTFALITFYGSLSEVCENQTQRARVSAYKSVFDTVSYALVYAAIPAVFKSINIPIWQVALLMSPLMISILIPLFMGRKDQNDKPFKPEANVPMSTSISLTLKSKPFVKWLIVNCIAFFGLQMFLVSQNTLISGIMNLGAGWAAVLNTCAFAPVPIMLFFFNKLRKKKGIRFAFQTCLLCFAIAIFSFNLGGHYFWGDNVLPKLIFGAIGGIIGSWGIGGFFMVPYLIPTVIASVEEEVTGKNHSAMYFAVQALTTSVIGAIASSLIYNYLKLWVSQTTVFSDGSGWKCGVSLVPLIVSVFCFIGFFLCFLMPKEYTAKVIFVDIKSSYEKQRARLLNKKNKFNNDFNAKKNAISNSKISENEKEVLIKDLEYKLNLKLANLSLEIEKIDKVLSYKFIESKSSANEEQQEIYERANILANIFLYFLSLMIFNIVDWFAQFNKYRILKIKFSKFETIISFLGLLIPFLSILTNYVMLKRLKQYCEKNSLNVHINYLPSIISSIFLPMFLNVFDLTAKNIYLNNILSLLEE